jgi:hypothetical protein
MRVSSCLREAGVWRRAVEALSRHRHCGVALLEARREALRICRSGQPHWGSTLQRRIEAGQSSRIRTRFVHWNSALLQTFGSSQLSPPPRTMLDPGENQAGAQATCRIEAVSP